MLVPVILSGGSGSRLWPLSRESYPKQFHALLSDYSLLQETLLRLEGLPGLASPLLICNEQHRFLVAEHLRAIAQTAAAIVLEPEGRNTAPAVAIAALQAQSQGEDPLLLVLPSDHSIADPAAFRATVQTAIALATAGHLVTFGIVPEAPETGYGYIKAGSDLDLGGFAIDRFVEKPDFATAETYVTSGCYYWNSGMFLIRASVYLSELARYAPEMFTACEAAWQKRQADLDFVRLDREAFAQCPSDSIDYAVMEHTQQGAVLPLQAGWTDVGSWSSLWQALQQDGAGNVTVGDSLALDCRNVYLRSEGRLVVGVGLEDVVAVETDDALLIAHRDRTQTVKQVVEALQREARRESRAHRKIYRPWGRYDSLDLGDRFQVKRITVNPGASLSLQMHHHRAEHWIVVKGTALVTRDNEEVLLTENQSTYIPVGCRHRLSNPGRVPLEMIEVQSGSYLEEDDIVRFEDHYGRS